MKLPKDLVAASAVPLVLSILEEGESYGYTILQRVRELSGGEIEWMDGMLYPVLHRLESQGVIDSRWDVSEAGRKRKYYSLSAAGKRALAEQKEQWCLVHATLAKLWGGPVMPDLEARILQWNQTLFTVFGGHPEIVEELESHLRDEIDRLTHAGQSPEAALAAAQAKLGRPVELAAEYSRAVGRAGWPVVGCWLGLLGLVCALLSAIIIRQVGLARGDVLVAVHVAAIVVGYVVAFAAAFLAAVYVVRWLVCPVNLGERRLVGQVLFLANGVAAGFLLLGIVLGMVWARQQWGISWSNDPREIATVLTVLWFAAITGLWWLLPHKQHFWMLLSWTAPLFKMGKQI